MGGKVPGRSRRPPTNQRPRPLYQEASGYPQPLPAIPLPDMGAPIQDKAFEAAVRLGAGNLFWSLRTDAAKAEHGFAPTAPSIVHLVSSSGVTLCGAPHGFVMLRGWGYAGEACTKCFHAGKHLMEIIEETA